MPLFDTEAEALRKANLKKLEDKRVRFAEKLEAEGFRPESMLMCSSEDGKFVALSRCEKGIAVIVGPRYDTDDDFIIEYHDHLACEREEIAIKGTGLSGMLGFGKKPANGCIYHITLENGESASLEIVMGRTSWLECDYKHNPLLKTKRRRGDANVVWDMRPFEREHVRKLTERMDNYYLV